MEPENLACSSFMCWSLSRRGVVKGESKFGGVASRIGPSSVVAAVSAAKALQKKSTRHACRHRYAMSVEPCAVNMLAWPVSRLPSRSLGEGWCYCGDGDGD